MMLWAGALQLLGCLILLLRHSLILQSWILIPFDLQQSLCSVNIVNQLALQQKKDQQKTNPNLMILSDKRMYLLLAVSGCS